MILTGLENSFLNAALFFWIVYLFIILFRDRVRELLNIDKLRFLLNRTSMTELDKSYLHLSRKLSNSSNMMHSLKSLVCCIRGLLHSFYTFPDPRPVGASDQEGGRKMCRWQGNVFFFFRCLTLPSYLRHFQFSSRSFPVRTWHRPICFRLVPFCFGFTYRFFQFRSRMPPNTRDDQVCVRKIHWNRRYRLAAESQTTARKT